MRVLHFCKSFSLLSETFIYDYITELERQGGDNHVVTFRRVNKESRPFPKVTVINWPSRWHPRRLWNRLTGTFQGRHAKVSFWPQIRDRLNTAVRKVDPDVIHAHFGPAGVLVAPIAQRLEIPLTVTFYGYDISELVEKNFWRECYGHLWSQMECATVLSEEMKQVAIRLGAPEEKLEVVHLSRDLEKFPFRFPSQKVRRLLFVGRLVEKKAPLDALEALQVANKEGAGLELQVAGDGPLESDIRRFVEEHEMEGEVILHGRVSNEEVTNLMQDSDAFLLPSKVASNGDREGTPTVLVEAQAVGLPCISTFHAGIPEMIPEANHGLLVKEGGVDELGKAMYFISNLSVERLRNIAERGRRKVEEDFSLSDEVYKLRRIYENNF